MNQNPLEIPFGLICVCHWVWSLPVSVVCISSKNSLEKNYFCFVSSYQRQLLGQGVRDGVKVHFSFAALVPHLAQTSASPVYIAIVSTRLKVLQPYCVQKDLFLWSLSFLLTLMVFPHSLLQDSLSFEGRDLKEMSHIRLSAPQSITLCTLSCEFPYFFKYCTRNTA